MRIKKTHPIIIGRVFYFWRVYKHLLIFLASILFSFIGNSQNQGIPIITNYESSDYKASPQNWGITQLPSGEILIANDYGLLIYNGRQWKAIEEDLGFTSHAIFKSEKRVYVGGLNELMALSSDSLGSIELKSVLPKLPDSISEFGVVEGILSHENRLTFHSENFLFALNGTDFKNPERVTTRIKTINRSLNRRLEKIGEKLELDKRISMHIARHTFGSIAGGNIPIQVLQKLYRHSSITTTVNYQRNFITEETDEALDTVINF